MSASTPATRDSFTVEAGVLPGLGIASGSVAPGDVHRQLSLKIKKLGGGAVRLTVKGTSPKNLTAQVTSADGYAIPGQRAKRLDGHGQVTFRLGERATGTYAVCIVRNPLTDLFWDTGKPPEFRRTRGSSIRTPTDRVPLTSRCPNRARLSVGEPVVSNGNVGSRTVL